MKRLTLSAIAGIILCAGMMRAQTIQTTWQQNAFTNQGTTGTSVIFRNINQSSHWLTWCVGGTGTFTSIQIFLEESADGQSNWQAISNVGVNQCGVVWAGGYYFAVRAHIAALTGTGSLLVNATYSASTGTIATPTNVGLAITSDVVTYLPITCPISSCVLSTKSAGATLVFGNGVIYGASLYNPNSGTVFVTFSGPSGPAIQVAVAANSSSDFLLPPQGVAITGSPVSVNCSTSSSSAVDPTTACIINPYYKVTTYNGPN